MQPAHPANDGRAVEVAAGAFVRRILPVRLRPVVLASAHGTSRRSSAAEADMTARRRGVVAVVIALGLGLGAGGADAGGWGTREYAAAGVPDLGRPWSAADIRT